MIVRVGIIDDDSTKVTQIMTRLLEHVKDASQIKTEKYTEYSLKPVEIELLKSIDEMIAWIRLQKLDAILIDYNLSSYAEIKYSGVELARDLHQSLHNFPIFILTAYEDNLYQREVFNSYQVFDFERYINEDMERNELNYKIIEQVLKTRKELDQWEKELKQLLSRAGENEKIDSRILELDSLIENSIDGHNALSEKIKKDLSSSKLHEILDEINKIIEEHDNEAD